MFSRGSLARRALLTLAALLATEALFGTLASAQVGGVVPPAARLGQAYKAPEKQGD